MLDWRRGWGQSAMMTYVYVHSTICATALVEWCYIDLLLIRGGGWGQSAIGICGFYYI